MCFFFNIWKCSLHLPLNFFYHFIAFFPVSESLILELTKLQVMQHPHHIKCNKQIYFFNSKQALSHSLYYQNYNRTKNSLWRVLRDYCSFWEFLLLFFWLFTMQKGQQKDRLTNLPFLSHKTLQFALNLTG